MTFKEQLSILPGTEFSFLIPELIYVTCKFFMIDCLKLIFIMINHFYESNASPYCNKTWQSHRYQPQENHYMDTLINSLFP